MLLVFVIQMALASAWDVALHRVPNALVVSIVATGLLASAIHGGLLHLVGSACGVVVVAAVLWLAWTRQWIGGGDLKLAAAAAAWLGIARVPAYLLGSAFAVGALSVICYAASERAARAEVRRNLVCVVQTIPVAPPITAVSGRVQVPAGAGFAIAAMIVLAMRGGL